MCKFAGTCALDLVTAVLLSYKAPQVARISVLVVAVIAPQMYQLIFVPALTVDIPYFTAAKVCFTVCQRIYFICLVFIFPLDGPFAAGTHSVHVDSTTVKDFVAVSVESLYRTGFEDLAVCSAFFCLYKILDLITALRDDCRRYDPCLSV